MNPVIVSGMWHCPDCGEKGPVEPVEPGESIYVDHRCGGYDDEDYR